MIKPRAKYPKRAHLLLCSSRVSCNNAEKGRATFDPDALKQRWRETGLSKLCFLQVTGCMGLCELGNSGLLVLPDRTVWLGGLTGAHLEALMGWLEASRHASEALPLPESILAQEVVRLEEPFHD